MKKNCCTFEKTAQKSRRLTEKYFQYVKSCVYRKQTDLIFFCSQVSSYGGTMKTKQGRVEVNSDAWKTRPCEPCGILQNCLASLSGQGPQSEKKLVQHVKNGKVVAICGTTFPVCVFHVSDQQEEAACFDLRPSVTHGKNEKIAPHDNKQRSSRKFCSRLFPVCVTYLTGRGM